ncbi:MAG: hypothetical protein JXB05_10910 [Myxococcaceae bacterium]|nr:hypothetical protein [Myxococcaceae bacterium]
MRVAVFVAVVVMALPAFAKEHKLKATKKDGTVITEVTYATGKYGEALEQVKAEAAKNCAPGDKRYEYILQKDDEKARSSFAACSKAAAGGETRAEAPKAEEQPVEPSQEAPAAASGATGGAPADSASCGDKQAFIVANAKWCDASGLMKKQDCGNKNGALMIEKMFPRCRQQVEKHEGDPGEAACKSAKEAMEKKDCATGTIVLKANDCSTAKGRRAIVNTAPSCK